jgi:hypothetical protein
MDVFAPGVSEKIGFYVYLLIDPLRADVFYVGKGIENRCFAHVVEARRTEAESIGDYAKLDRIRAIEKAGAQVRIDILRHGLNEREAFLVESAAIDLMGLPSLTNRVVGYEAAELGRMSVGNVNALYGAKPVEIAVQHRVVLIRINRLFDRGMSDAQLYEATRQWWRIGPRRRESGSAWSPQWALSVFGGIVRAVYRIEDWRPATDDDINLGRGVAGRWSFCGERDQTMEAIYLNGDVSSYLRGATSGRGSQNPMRFVNCGGHQLVQEQQ